MKITSAEFAANFHPKEGEEFIIWKEDSRYAGFSVLRSYKKGLGFVPAMTNSRKEDTKALIKVGIRIPEDLIRETPVLLSVSKHSKYRSSHFGINFTDEDAPTRESLNESENSKQPIDLESRDEFIVHLNDKTSFFKKATNETISSNELVDWVYNLHLQTISSGKGRILKAKINLKNIICNRIIPKLIIWFKISLGVFGKEIENDNVDFAIGLFKPYSFSKHIKTKYPYSLPFFSTNERVSLFNIFWISISLFVLWYLYFAKRNIDGVFSISLSIILIFVFEFVIPFLILKIINILIVFRSWYERMKFKFK